MLYVLTYLYNLLLRCSLLVLLVYYNTLLYSLLLSTTTILDIPTSYLEKKTQYFPNIAIIAIISLASDPI